MRPLLFRDDLTFWYETQRVLGHIAYGGADFGEAVTTAERIAPGDYDSWHEQWRLTAERVEAEARERLAAGHEVSCRDGLLRAATYFRSAEFFTRDRQPDPRGRGTYEASVSCFRDAVALFSPPVTPVEIPFEGTTLNGYFYLPAGHGPHPLLIIHNGFDGAAEELHHGGAAAAQERGYAVLIFDGPGQPGPRYRDGLVFRPDWEMVVGPVIDWATARPEVDTARIALMGNSMGGELAPRAAAYEPRIAALICIDGVYDFGAVSARLQLGNDTERRLRADSDPEVDEMLTRMMKESTQMRWALRQGMWSFGTGTPRAFMAAALDYQLRDGIAELISCPVFVGRAESDEFFTGQPEQLVEHLRAPATLASFTDAEGAGAHCQAGAQRTLCARMLDWLDDTLTHVPARR